MGFNADYKGHLTIEPPLNPAEIKALSLFLDARHVKTVHGPLDIRQSLHNGHPDVTDWNSPAQDLPGLYAGLRVAEDGTYLEWDGEEKPGDLTDWVRYVVDYLLRPCGIFSEKAQLVPETDLLHAFTFDHVVNGKMLGTARGEAWLISVVDNEVTRHDEVRAESA